MELSKSLKKFLYSTYFSTKGIPEGKPILDKFFDIYWEAKKLRDRLIEKEFSNSWYEKKNAKAGRSRVIFPISLATASVAISNGYKDVVDIVANQMLAYGEATTADDFHDNILFPRYLKDHSELTEEMLYQILNSPEKQKQIAKKIASFSRMTIPVYPTSILNSSLKLAKMYKKRMSEKQEAFDTYLKARDNLFKIQAKTLFISSALERRDYVTVKKKLEEGGGNYEQSVIKLGDKLAHIGQENAAIVFEATRPQSLSEEKCKEIKNALRVFYHGSTLLKQFTQDDSLKLKEDLKKNA